ncbi:hypothetical protein JOM56_007957 [Amanita muscaria]
MDSQTTAPAVFDRPDERNEFSNTGARNMFKSVPNYCHNSRSAAPTGARQAGASTLQGHITPPDDDYAPVPATISLTLPRELVERILLLLDTKSMLKCRLVNREFNATIQSSTLAQYYLACKAAGVVDNPQSPLSYAERLEALKKREDAWRKLKPVFETTIKVIDQSTSYELTAGNYLLSDKNGEALHYCRLPSSPQNNPQWFSIPGHGPGQSWSGSIVEMGMAVYEHDLVVNVIFSEVENQADMQRHSLDLVLLKFSTGEYHPLARHPLIHVERSPSTAPYTLVRIVGDNLALVVHDLNSSKLFIFDWKTGHKRLQHEATEHAYKYSVPVFVSPGLLLVPNLILSLFEVWQLFPSHPNSKFTPVQILSLQIPAASVNCSISSIYCHGEPSPFLHSMPYFPPQPFFPSLENSIIIVKLRIRLESGVRSAYKLIMDRCALLDIIQKWTSPSLLEQREGLPTWLTTEVTVHKVADPDDGSVRLAAQSELVSMIPHSGSSPRTRDSPTVETSQISPTSPTLHISADCSSSSISSGSASSTSRYDILQVQWADWGPPISRWFQLSGTYNYTWWIHQSTGQRFVFLDRDPHDKSKCSVGVADFNLHNVRRNAEMTAQLREKDKDNGGNDNDGEGKKEDDEDEMEILDHEGVFSEEVHMGLKCVIYHAPGEYDFDGVLMDEERLVGLKLDGENRVESFKVLYIG